MHEDVTFFKEHGYCVVPNVLSMEDVARINRAIDTDREKHPEIWQNRGGGRFQNPNILLGGDDFDLTIFHPKILPLATLLMGEEICFGEFSVMIREPIAGAAPESRWHRDSSHWPEHPLALLSLSVIYYLTDVDESTHCFGIVPETIDQKRQMPTDLNGEHAVPLHGKAGTAIFFNAGSCHDVMYRTTDKERRTIHLYYGHRTQKATSNHTIFPGRFLTTKDPNTRHLFLRPNRITKLVQQSFLGGAE